ncbi:hypothetical protein BDW22DRAFT_1352825 [Trametopsis cervina]|nr:hypothetical protein BDW22DRAFT_1352825 [Trametopsis cervina]
MAILKLPLYPGLKARDTLSPSQIATLNTAIAATLSQVLTLPQDKSDKAAAVSFISSYAKDHAQRILHALIWEDTSKRVRHLSKLSPVERTIHERAFRLSERIANELDVQTLIDLAVVYGATNPKRFRVLLVSISNNSQLIKAIETEAAPAFATLLSSNAQGLYGLRKISYILWALMHSASPEVIRPFARNKEFVVALAKAYDDGLATCARSYGGMRAERINSSNVPLDDWERIFLDTKVSLIDSFHILLRTLLKDVEELSTPGPALAARTEIAFEVVSSLLDLPSSSSTQGTETTPIPFLNQSLLADYQHTYGLSKLISNAGRRTNDPRAEVLEASLRSLDSSSPDQNASTRPGALKLLIRSSGIQPGIDRLGKGPSRTDAKGKGKEVAVASPAPQHDPALDAAVSQVLDILPDQPPEYLRFLLAHQDYPYRGNAERLIEALLEGTAPTLEEYENQLAHTHQGAGVAHDTIADVRPAVKDDFVYTKERRNVFDEEIMDISHLRVGKKPEDAQVNLNDRAYIEEMKADILRRAEAMVDDEDEEDETDQKPKGIDVAFEDELDEGGLKVRDGEESEEGESGDETEGQTGAVNTPRNPETILELAYIADIKLFERDAQTRRSKARENLRAQTGWSDEQIEGWRIMLERNPNKDKILQKHEFSGNRRGPLLEVGHAPQGHPGRGGGRGGGRGSGGRGGGRGRGRGGSSQGGGGGGDGQTARDRAWKDKNKASRANHNRKGGHDKKMARAGGPS